MNLAYQIRRHMEHMRRKWPQQDPNEQRRQVRRLLLAGQAWVFPEPVQMELF